MSFPAPEEFGEPGLRTEAAGARAAIAAYGNGKEVEVAVRLAGWSGCRFIDRGGVEAILAWTDNKVILAARGTKGWKDLLVDASSFYRPLVEVGGTPFRMGAGFFEYAGRLAAGVEREAPAKLALGVRSNGVLTLVDDRTWYFLGHSLGCYIPATALMLAGGKRKIGGIYLYCAPRMGSKAYDEAVKALGCPVTTIHRAVGSQMDRAARHYSLGDVVHLGEPVVIVDQAPGDDMDVVRRTGPEAWALWRDTNRSSRRWIKWWQGFARFAAWKDAHAGEQLLGCYQFLIDKEDVWDALMDEKEGS